VVAITSALPREGKTMTSLCLTRALAQSGANTLIIDCDTRRSSMTQMLGRPEAGLVEVLQGKTPVEKALMHDPRTNAWVLPSAGRGAAPQDLLTAPKLDELLESLKQQFDYIILDTPPILAVADARILAAKADATLMIVEWNKTPARATASAVELLNEAGANVVGAALNKVDVRAQARYGLGDSIYSYKSANEYFAN
jgi:capsular exopolysaccharide synthesis family protein